jgi:hypothetical protein
VEITLSNTTNNPQQIVNQLLFEVRIIFVVLRRGWNLSNQLNMQHKLQAFEEWLKQHCVQRPEALYVREIAPGNVGVIFEGDLSILKPLHSSKNSSDEEERQHSIFPSPKKFKVQHTQRER